MILKAIRHASRLACATTAHAFALIFKDENSSRFGVKAADLRAFSSILRSAFRVGRFQVGSK